MISCLAYGLTLPKALERAETLLGKVHKTDPILSLLGAAEEQANNHPAGKTGTWDHIDSIASLGSGENAEEALAIAVYCTLPSTNRWMLSLSRPTTPARATPPPPSPAPWKAFASEEASSPPTGPTFWNAANLWPSWQTSCTMCTRNIIL